MKSTFCLLWGELPRLEQRRGKKTALGPAARPPLLWLLEEQASAEEPKDGRP